MTSRLATAFPCSLVTLLGSASARMTVLLIAGDDLRPELGCYGVRYALLTGRKLPLSIEWNPVQKCPQ